MLADNPPEWMPHQVRHDEAGEYFKVLQHLRIALLFTVLFMSQCWNKK
jgi:hypothetical protein